MEGFLLFPLPFHCPLLKGCIDSIRRTDFYLAQGTIFVYQQREGEEAMRRGGGVCSLGIEKGGG